MEDLKEIYMRSLRQLYGDLKTEEELEKIYEEKINFRKIPKDSLGFHLHYFDYIISTDEIKSIEEEYSELGIECVGRNKTDVPFNNIEELVNSIVFYLPPNMVIGILMGSLGSGFWDFTKNTISVIGKRIKKGFVKEKTSIILTTKIDEMNEINFIFPKQDLEIDEVGQIIKKFKETLKDECSKIEDAKETIPKDAIKIARYVSDEKNWKVNSLLNEIKKNLRK